MEYISLKLFFGQNRKFQVVVGGEDEEERAVLCADFWRAGVRTVVSESGRMDELTELAKDLGAEVVILAASDHAR